MKSEQLMDGGREEELSKMHLTFEDSLSTFSELKSESFFPS